jgi:hypothetical protein
MALVDRLPTLRHYEERNSDPVGRPPCGELLAEGRHPLGNKVRRRRRQAPCALAGRASGRHHTLPSEESVINHLVHGLQPLSVTVEPPRLIHRHTTVTPSRAL